MTSGSSVVTIGAETCLLASAMAQKLQVVHAGFLWKETGQKMCWLGDDSWRRVAVVGGGGWRSVVEVGGEHHASGGGDKISKELH